MRKPTLEFASLEDLLDFCKTVEVFNGFINKDLFQFTARLTDAAIELSQHRYGAKEVSLNSLSNHIHSLE